MKKKIFFLLLACICIKPSAAPAAGLCCQLSSGVRESLAGVAAPAEEEVSLQFTYSLSKMDRIKEGGETRSLSEAALYVKPDGSRYTSLPISMDMAKYTLTAGYGFSSKLKAFVSIPSLRNTMDMTSYKGAMTGWTDMTMAPVSGFGDVTAMALYRLYTNRDIRPSDVVTAGLGVKAATGSFTETTASGKFVHAHMQPGTGSWDPLFSLLYTKMAGQFLVQADATYQYTTRNRQGYEFGDSFAATVTGAYAVIRQFNIAAGLTYLRVGRAADDDGKYYNAVTNHSLMDDPANTGGQSIWFSPELQIFPVKDLALNLKLQLPVRERVNGIQLVSRYRTVMGVSYSF